MRREQSQPLGVCTGVRLTILALLCGSARGVFGCSCTPPGPACVELGKAGAVFAGTVTSSVLENGADGRSTRYSFDVIEAFRGVHGPVVTTNSALMCGYRFEVDRQYLVYATAGKTGLQTYGVCTRTAPLEAAEEDLAFLRSLASRGPEGRIGGYVSTQSVHRWERYEGKGAIAGAPVWLESDHGKIGTVTNGRGEYEFGGLFPGGYRLWVDLPGKLGGGEPRNVIVPPQACVTEVIIATEPGSISGVLHDAEGRPLEWAKVELVRASDGKPAGRQFTDRQGRYRIEEIPQGEYLVGVHVSYAPEPSGPFYAPWKRSYFPGVSDAAAATVIRVKTAESVTGVDWVMGPTLDPRVIRGVVLGPDDKPAPWAHISLEAEGYRGPAGSTSSGRDGKFLLIALAELDYSISASVRDNTGNDSWHCHRLPVPGGIEPLILRLDRPGQDCDACRPEK